MGGKDAQDSDVKSNERNNITLCVNLGQKHPGLCLCRTHRCETDILPLMDSGEQEIKRILLKCWTASCG